jgi:hypothetical protein
LAAVTDARGPVHPERCFDEPFENGMNFSTRHRDCFVRSLIMSIACIFLEVFLLFFLPAIINLIVFSFE